MTPAQCCAARAVLEWSELKLANRALVSILAVRGYEAGWPVIRQSTIDVIQRTFEGAGVTFIEPKGHPPCIRLR